MTTPSRLAVVGGGHLGRIHARIADRNPEFDLVAIVDPAREARERIAAETNARPFPDLEAAAGTFDAAILAAPTTLHHELGLRLLEQGTPVLIEKPIAFTTREADQLVAAAREQQTILQVGHVERFNPAFATLPSDLNEVRYIECRRLSPFPFRSLDIGVVLDLMIHDLDLVLSMVDAPVVDVRASGGAVMGGHEDMASARIEFSTGCVAQLTAARISYRRERTMNIITRDRFFALDLDTGQTTTVTPSEAVRSGELDLAACSPDRRDHLRERFFEEVLVKSESTPAAINAIEEEQREFAAAITGRLLPRVSGRDGRNALALAELILGCIEVTTASGTEESGAAILSLPARPSRSDRQSA